MGRRRQRDDGGQGGELLDALIELAKRSPLIGLGAAGVLLGIGAALVWGDSKRLSGSGPLIGVFPLLMGGLVGLISLFLLLRNAVAPAARAPVVERAADGEGPRAAAPARDGRAFEGLVAAHFRGQGYVVEETGTHGTGGDRGVDLILRRPDSPAAPTVCVQCKDFAKWKVGAPDVRAFHGAVCLRGPGQVGWIVTSGRVTAEARRDAAQLEIRLIDGEAWASMQSAAGTADAPAIAPPPPANSPAAADVPLCPACRVAMVRREPTPGGKAFAPFWGCRNYPRCRRRVDIA